MTAVPTLAQALSGWIGGQRWFAGKGGEPRLRVLGALDWPAHDGIRITTQFVLDESAEQAVLYQLPVTFRDTALHGAEHARIGRVAVGGRELHAYDGTHDPAFTELLLRLILDEGAAGTGEFTARGVRVRRSPDPAADEPGSVQMSSRVLTGEQSNTSIVYAFDGGAGRRQVICKVFRSLHHGENPDVVLQSALSAAGSGAVPAVVGSVVGEWPDAGRRTGRARGHLAFAQEFVAGAEDAWRIALDAAAKGRDFSTGAREMGAAVADVHAMLAAVLPARAAARGDVDEAVAGWQERLDAAVREVPELESLRSPIEELYRRARDASWPRLQRIHGDLHLGQILAVPGDGWAIIDFEGEPMRSLESRSRVDVPLRDVAGMLRSFDYVAGASEETTGVADWARACRSAFVEGYGERAQRDPRADGVLLDAFELDKALYEAVYEARNRPTWLHIPVAAVRRLALRVA